MDGEDAFMNGNAAHERWNERRNRENEEQARENEDDTTPSWARWDSGNRHQGSRSGASGSGGGGFNIPSVDDDEAEAYEPYHASHANTSREGTRPRAAKRRNARRRMPSPPPETPADQQQQQEGDYDYMKDLQSDGSDIWNNDIPEQAPSQAGSAGFTHTAPDPGAADAGTYPPDADAGGAPNAFNTYNTFNYYGNTPAQAEPGPEFVSLDDMIEEENQMTGDEKELDRIKTNATNTHVTSASDVGKHAELDDILKEVQSTIFDSSNFEFVSPSYEEQAHGRTDQNEAGPSVPNPNAQKRKRADLFGAQMESGQRKYDHVLKKMIVKRNNFQTEAINVDCAGCMSRIPIANHRMKRISEIINKLMADCTLPNLCKIVNRLYNETIVAEQQKKGRDFVHMSTKKWYIHFTQHTDNPIIRIKYLMSQTNTLIQAMNRQVISRTMSADKKTIEYEDIDHSRVDMLMKLHKHILSMHNMKPRGLLFNAEDDPDLKNTAHIMNELRPMLDERNSKHTDEKDEKTDPAAESLRESMMDSAL